jgi:DNA-binding NtrC family response regulator
MPASLQTRLLRVLAEGEFFRVGGRELIRVDVRVIAATHQDLEARVRAGAFRADLLHRLDVVRLQLPPLRERREDIGLLADHFLAKFAASMKKPVRGISREALDLLLEYSWPGNVRELENVIERAVALEQTPAVLPETLPEHILSGRRRPQPVPMMPIVGVPGGEGAKLPDLGEGFDLEAQGEQFYRYYITLALARAGGVQTRAAELLGMSFRSFRYYAKKFNII